MYNSRVNVNPIRRKKLAFPIAKVDRENFLYDGNGFFRFLKILGCFSIIKKDGHIQFQWASWQTVYTVIFNAFSMGWGLWSAYIIVWNLQHKNFEFEEAILYSTFLTFLVVQTVPFLSFFEAQPFACYLEDWGDFQELFTRITGKKLVRKTTRFWIISVLTVPVLAILSLYAGDESFDSIITKYQLDPKLHNTFLLATTVISITISLYGYLWFSLTRTVVHASEALIQDVESLRWTANGSIRNHEILWFNLRQLCLHLGSCLNWSYLYISIAFFGISLPMIYLGAFQILQGNIVTLLTSFCSLILISAFAEWTHQAVDKVSSNFEKRVTSLVPKVRDTQLENELLRFAEKIATHPVVVFLGGFFPLNRSLNASMYSSVITYLIIIVQFRGVTNEIALPK